MQLNGMPTENTEWTQERIFAGERLYCALQTETVTAIDLAVGRVTDARRLMSRQDIACIIAHSLMETAMRQAMATKTPLTLPQWLDAARLVYLSCHLHDEKGHEDANSH